MKNAVLAISTHSYINIGDYIQGLAPAQFFSKTDLYIERERLNSYDGDQCRMIMNGWYMHHPEHWPPTDKITPLFVSFHVTPSAKQVMTLDRSIAYLKQHQPIGCRDHQTMNILIENGVEAYFSSCMTTTLGKKYRSNKTSDNIYIVDPICTLKATIWNALRIIVGFLLNLGCILKLLKKHIWADKTIFRQLMLTTIFYTEYRKILSKEELLKATYISHIIPNTGSTNEELMLYAEELVKKYAEAKLVITSRIHCALPCLSLQTPVLYIEYKQQSKTSSSRLVGLQELFHVIVWDRSGMRLTVDAALVAKIGSNLKNKDTWRVYSDRLIELCSQFVSN